MAAAGSSSNNATLKYDVFLSFSGVDTRKGFTSTLFDFLKTKGIEAFIDDGLPRGEQIQALLDRTIEQSMIAVVIFSKKYASSSWCLEELVKIKECNLIIMPVFYNVKPEHVHEQSGKFGDEFTKLKRITHSKIKLKQWSAHLAFAATQSGWDLANYRTEIDLVKEVAASILKKLDSFSLSTLSSRFIGIASVIDDLQMLLTDKSSRFQFLGIWGMGGIGKTTVAEALYHQFSRQFDACYFAAIGLHESTLALVVLRNRIISRILGDDFDEQTPNQLPTYVLSRLRKTKVLIVLDNVCTSDQVTTLVGTKEDCWFASGSKVVVTSRDSSVFKDEDMNIFEIKEMSQYYSLRLFCLNAFKQNQPFDDEDYERLSMEMVDYARGLPLALKILGSHLFKRPKTQWESTLEKLNKLLDPRIEEVLKISYELLDDAEKEIFLDIACFFKGDDKDRVQYILDGCGFSATIGITRLIEKCLVTLSVDNKLGLHDLVQKMGWDIIEKQSRSHFGLRRRFWKPNDSCNVLRSYQEAKANEGEAETIEGIFLDMFESESLIIHPMAFSKMQNLRLLKFKQAHPFNTNIILCEELQFLPNSIRLLLWDELPDHYLPSTFSAENVIELSLRRSYLKRMWKEIECSINLRRLKVLDLQDSKYLTELPNLTSAANLEKIILDGCIGLNEIPASIEHLQSLSNLSLRMCTNLRSLPSLLNIKTLKKLDLFGCICFKRFPETSEDIEELNLQHTAVVEWPGSMINLKNLKDLKVPRKLQTLPIPLHLSSMKELNLANCPLKKFPRVIGDIQKLNLQFTQIEELPSSIVLLTSLVELDLSYCFKLKWLPNNFGQLNCLETLNLTCCSELFEGHLALSGLSSIQKLYLDGCKLRKFPSWICVLSSLQVLSLSNNGFISVPDSIRQLSLLEALSLKGCRNLRYLPELPYQVNDLDVYSTTPFVRNKGLEKPQVNNLKSSGHRFCFLECEDLGEGGYINIVKNAMLRIQQIANNREEDLIFPLRVSLPSSEIPNFLISCEGSSIDMKLPSNWCNNMFRGFVFGVVVDAPMTRLMFMRTRFDYHISFRCDFRDEAGSYLDSYCATFKFDELQSELMGWRSLILQYSGDIYSLDRGYKFYGGNSTEIYEETDFPSRRTQLFRANHKDATYATFYFNTSEWKVSKCGVHLVYADQNDPASIETIGVETEWNGDSNNGTRFGKIWEILIKRLSCWQDSSVYEHS